MRSLVVFSGRQLMVARGALVFSTLALSLNGCVGPSPIALDDAAAPDALEVSDAAPSDDASASADVASPDGGVPLADAAVTADAAVVADAAMTHDAPPPSFDHIYESILRPRCARCHIDEDPGSYRYSPRLTDVETAYLALLDVPVETSWVRFCVPDGVTAYRVRPRDLTASMLAFLPSCYVRDADHSTLTAEDLAEIRAWIAAGAPRESF